MKKILFVVFALVVLASCKKEDPLIGDFIEGTWVLNSYYRNNVDETTLINISSYVETYGSNGVFSRTYNDINGDPVSESGKYSISEDDKTIHLTDISSISDFSDEHSSLSTSSINITTFNETSLIYNFENGGDKHEFRFHKQ